MNLSRKKIACDAWHSMYSARAVSINLYAPISKSLSVTPIIITAPNSLHSGSFRDQWARPTLQTIKSAIRETGVSWDILGPSTFPPLISQYNSAAVVWELSGGPHLGPMVPRDASLSDSHTFDRCCFSSPVLNLASLCMQSACQLEPREDF